MESKRLLVAPAGANENTNTNEVALHREEQEPQMPAGRKVTVVLQDIMFLNPL